MRRFLVALLAALAIGCVPVAASAASTKPDSCTSIPAAVSRKKLPADVKDWARGDPVIGHGPIWVFRQNLQWDRKYQPWLPSPDGTFGLGKVAWFLRDEYEGIPTITGRRLDGPGTFSARVNGARSGGHDWIAPSLTFSTAGCWKVVGAWKDETVAFRILVG